MRWAAANLPGALACPLLAFGQIIHLWKSLLVLVSRNLWWPCALRLHYYPRGMPGSFFWCCAALQCTSPPVLSSPAVGCRKKITSQCHCWFIKLNCFLLSCVLCLSRTSWECLEPKYHNLKQDTQHWSGLLNCFFNMITVFFIGDLYSLCAVIGHDFTQCITVYVLKMSKLWQTEGKYSFFWLLCTIVFSWLLTLR